MCCIDKVKDKFQCYEYIKEKLTLAGVYVDEYKKINYGVQFYIKIKEEKETIRIYESKKKGITIDFSQVKSSENLKFIKDVLYNNQEKGKVKNSDKNSSKDTACSNENIPLIGTDESGKGDFFGPLVIAGVYADLNTQKILRVLGVDDSKKLTDKKIASMAIDIRKLCPHSVVVIGNESYNKLYAKIGNLNKILAWGHARAIENVLEQVECENALSDQFGNPKLIENALMKKGQKIKLSQRPKAEENVVVAAASILARDAYVNAMKKMEERYCMEFVKGASNMTICIGKEFKEKYGKHRLIEVSKTHFSTFKKI